VQDRIAKPVQPAERGLLDDGFGELACGIHDGDPPSA
jgi:hypothetical protein